MKVFSKRNNAIFFLVITFCFSILIIPFERTQESQTVGVYWGAFDPPTEAHRAIIATSLGNKSIKKLFIVVNNHSYKNYANSLDSRIEMLKKMLSANELKSIDFITQDDGHKIDYIVLSKMTTDGLLAIAGYDSYSQWVNYSDEQERAAYQTIAVVPRGDDEPKLYDRNAFIMPIDPKYKYVSSTQLRGYATLRSVEK